MTTLLPITSIPGWPTALAGIMETLQAVTPCFIAPEGLYVGDATAAQAFLTAYSGSAQELTWSKTKKQTQLDALFDANFDLAKFIRSGTATNVSAANVGTFLATITNNYRSLRSQIANAATVSALNAININSGWPSNP